MKRLKAMAQSERDRIHITDIKVFGLKGHGIQSIIRVDTDAGIYGVGEPGLPAVIVQSYLDFMKEWLIGQDVLAIDKCYADMTRMRAQWHAHWTQNPTVSGIDMALWDIAGKVFNQPVSQLLTGQYRDEIELYVNTDGPKDWLDPSACRDWAQEIKADPYGFKTVKMAFENMLGRGVPRDCYRGGFLSRLIKPTELRVIRKGYENVREALGWEYDIIVHCHNEFDLPTALRLAEAVAPIKPLWLEDALPVMYSDTWKALGQRSPVPLITGEKLEHPAEFLQFIANGAVQVIQPDISFVGGLTGGRKIADLAEMYYIPISTHMCGSYIQLVATAHYGASVRNFVISECRVPDNHLYPEMSEECVKVKNGKMKVPPGPGLGITIRPDVMKEIIEIGKW